MLGENAVQRRVKLALRAAKDRMPGFDYNLEKRSDSHGKPIGMRVILKHQIPMGYENEDLAKMQNRFMDESETVSDIFQAYGLPKLSSEDWGYESLGTKSGNYQDKYDFDNYQAYTDLANMNFGKSPDPAYIDGLVTNRLAGDDTPPDRARNLWEVPPLKSDELMTVAASKTIQGDRARGDELTIDSDTNDIRSVMDMKLDGMNNGANDSEWGVSSGSMDTEQDSMETLTAMDADLREGMKPVDRDPLESNDMWSFGDLGDFLKSGQMKAVDPGVEDAINQYRDRRNAQNAADRVIRARERNSVGGNLPSEPRMMRRPGRGQTGIPRF